ncbi:hypothetical protein BDW62DRAFT_192042 [Aspergillus aurantiobrunneus]
MLPRGRPCLKRCGLSTHLADCAASHKSLPDEPLLFLYPRWLTSTASEQQRSINTVLGRRKISHAIHGDFLSRSTAHRSPTRRQSSVAPPAKRWLPRASKPRLPGSNFYDTDEPFVGSEEPKSTVRRGNKRERSTIDSIISEALTELENEGYAKIESSVLEHNWDLLWQQGFSPSREVYRQNQALLKQLPGRKRRNIRRRQYHLNDLEPESRVSVYERIKWLFDIMEKQSKGEDFLPNSFTKDDTQKREIRVPDETIALFAGVSERFSQSENVWFERVRNGCRVHVLPSAESEGHNRRVVLWGSIRATELLANRILRMQELQDRGDPLVDIQKPLVPAMPSRLPLERSGTLAPLVRGVWNYKSSSRRRVSYDLLRFQSENISTVRGFLEHVEELTKCLPSKRPGPTHPLRVSLALKKLFCGDSKRHLISTTALNTAVMFLINHNYLGFVQELINNGGHVATTETFNILLRDAGRLQNLLFFVRILQVMGHFRIRPDVDTWLAYLQCLISPVAKLRLVKVIERKGYLKDPYVMRAILHLMIQDLLGKHLKDGGSMDEFFSKIIETAGLNWFPTSLITKMFVVTAQLEDAPAMKRLLEICQENKLPLTGEMAFEFIRFFPEDTFSAVHYVLQALDDPEAVLSQEVFARLYVNARKNRHYNICRVLWRYACMNDAVSRSMREDVTFLLYQNVASDHLSEIEKLWLTSAGKVIVGVDLHLPKYPLKHELLEHIPVEFHDNPVAFLLPTQKLEEEKFAKNRRIAKAIIKHDVEVGSWYRPTRPLAYMLQAAVELDREWKGVPRPAKWLMQHAIHIPVELVGHKFRD